MTRRRRENVDVRGWTEEACRRLCCFSNALLKDVVAIENNDFIRSALFGTIALKVGVQFQK